MPPSKPAKTYEERCALADKKEALKAAKLAVKEAKPSAARNQMKRALAKYEKLTQDTLAKLQPAPTLSAKKVQQQPAPAPAPAPIPAPAVTNLVAEAEASTEEEN